MWLTNGLTRNGNVSPKYTSTSYTSVFCNSLFTVRFLSPRGRCAYNRVNKGNVETEDSTTVVMYLTVVKDYWVRKERYKTTRCSKNSEHRFLVLWFGSFGFWFSIWFGFCSKLCMQDKNVVPEPLAKHFWNIVLLAGISTAES